MQTVFLIMYLWHANQAIHNGQPNTTIAMNGGPVFLFERMPSLAACEAVGAAAKDLADRSIPRWEDGDYHHVSSMSTPASFRCISVPRE